MTNTRERRAPARQDERRRAEPGLGAPGKDDAVPAGYKMTEVGMIPEDWEVATIGDEFSVQLGKMLDVEKNVGVSKPFLGNRAVQWGRIDANDMGSIKLTPSDLRRFRLRDGDLLVCEGGEIGRAAIWRQELPECYYQKALHRLRPKRSYNTALMLNVLYRFVSTGFLINYVTQTSIAHLPKDKLETVPIPLPNPAEQQAIATALSDVDELIASLEKLIAKKRAIKTGTMQQLLTPPGQPGHKRLPGFSGEWEVKRFDEVLTRLNAKEHQIQASDYQQTGRWPVVDQGKTSIIGFSDRTDMRFQCPDGGVIVFGDHTCIVKFVDFDFLVGADGTQVLRARDGQCCRFHTFDLQRRSINPTGYNRHFRFLKEREFLSPPLDEQTAIATILSDMDAEIEALEARLEKTRAIKQGMMQALLTGRVRLVGAGDRTDPSDRSDPTDQKKRRTP